MHRQSVLVLLTALVLVVAACGDDSGGDAEGRGADTTAETSGQAAPLEGTEWGLESYDTSAGSGTVPGGVQKPTLLIEADGTVSLFTGCNTAGGSAEVADDTIAFAPLASTLIGCEGDTATVETAITTTLDGEVSYRIEGQQLTITKGESTLVYGVLAQ